MKWEKEEAKRLSVADMFSRKDKSGGAGELAISLKRLRECRAMKSIGAG